jgi:hypothetical protein
MGLNRRGRELTAGRLSLASCSRPGLPPPGGGGRQSPSGRAGVLRRRATVRVRNGG